MRSETREGHEELLAQRDQEVLEKARTREESRKEMEARARKRVESTIEALGSFREVFDRVGRVSEETAAEARQRVARVRSELVKEHADGRPAHVWTGQPPVVYLPNLVVQVKPYYRSVYNSDGTSHGAAYNPEGADAFSTAVGSGNGLVLHGDDQTVEVLVDWWYQFQVPEDRMYTFYVKSPMKGFYISHADDGSFDSKHADANFSIQLSAFQGNAWQQLWGGGSAIPIDAEGDNIDEHKPFEAEPVTYYFDILASGPVTLRQTQTLYCYARGDGSYAELYFADGTGHALTAPTVSVY